MAESFNLLPTDTLPDANEEIMLEVLSILTSATVGVKLGKRIKFIQEKTSELISGRDILLYSLFV